jgi:hypothetical protein
MDNQQIEAVHIRSQAEISQHLAEVWCFLPGGSRWRDDQGDAQQRGSESYHGGSRFLLKDGFVAPWQQGAPTGTPS